MIWWSTGDWKRQSNIDFSWSPRLEESDCEYEERGLQLFRIFKAMFNLRAYWSTIYCHLSIPTCSERWEEDLWLLSVSRPHGGLKPKPQTSGPEPDVRLSKAVDLSKARNCDHFQSSTHSRRSAWGWCGAFWGDEGELPLWRLIYLATIEGVQEIFFSNLKSTLTRRSFEVCLWDLHHDLSFPKEFNDHNNLWKDWGGRWEGGRGRGSWRSIFHFYISSCTCFVFCLSFLLCDSFLAPHQGIGSC